MEIKKCHTLFFSPTGTTKKIVTGISKGTGLEVVEYNLTHVNQLPSIPVFSKNELVVIGLPVYVGRIPPVIIDTLALITGKETPCVLVGVYGNRAFEDMLAELEDITRENGLLPVAAAAFIGEHSFSNKLAGGRPNADDLQTAHNFGAAIMDKINSSETVPTLSPGTIPGNRPYRDGFVGGGKLCPVINDNCINCNACVNACPTNAIKIVDGNKEIDKLKCTWCRACAHSCSTEGIDFVRPSFWEHTDELISAYGNIYLSPDLII